jgi:hypothetical protein
MEEEGSELPIIKKEVTRNTREFITQWAEKISYGFLVPAVFAQTGIDTTPLITMFQSVLTKN